MSNYDHYAEARAIAEALESTGDDARAAEIRIAISTAVSGTETFMKLRSILKSKPSEVVDPAMAARFTRLIRELDASLR